MRTIDVDFRFTDSMEKCKEEIVKQIRAIESGMSNIDSPIKFTKRAKLIDHSISEAKIINSEISETGTNGREYTGKNKESDRHIQL
jgi:hypothetical protein